MVFLSVKWRWWLTSQVDNNSLTGKKNEILYKLLLRYLYCHPSVTTNDAASPAWLCFHCFVSRQNWACAEMIMFKRKMNRWQRGDLEDTAEGNRRPTTSMIRISLTCRPKQISPWRSGKILLIAWLCSDGSKGQRGGPDRMNVIFPEPPCCHVKAGRNFG